MLLRGGLTLLMLLVGLAASTRAQSTSTASAGSTTASSTMDTGRLVRDPLTGRLYYQQWVSESVPTVRWETRQVNTTIYETGWVNQVVPSVKTELQPQTQYVLQPYWQGAWNPFRQPTLAYQFKPVVTYVPTTTTVNQVIARQQMVPKQQTISVPHPVTEMKTQQRMVQTEVPQTTSTVAQAPAVPLAAYTAHQRPALVNLGQFANRWQVAPVYPPSSNFVASSYIPPSTGLTQPATAPVAYAPPTRWSTPAGQQSGFASTASGLRPVARAIQTVMPASSYATPLRTATGHGSSWSSLQSGMQPTVLR